MRPIALAAFTALTLPLAAQDGPAMSGPEFEAATTGRTLTFSIDGTPYGAEQYFAGQRLQWSFLDGRCLTGRWEARGRQICFTYEDRPDETTCWEFWAEAGGLRARVAGDPGATARYTARETDGPLYCMGPDAGV